jgi:plastocyanin
MKGKTMKKFQSLLLTCFLLSLSLMNPAWTTHATSFTATAVNCPKVVKITIKNFKYNDGVPVTIRTGDYVVWFNADDMPHTATATSASEQSFDTGILQPGEASEPRAFLKASGAAGFPYSCGIHPGMSGNLIVTAPTESDMPADCDHHQTPSEHSMVVLGNDPNSFFLHHIALFNDYNHFYHVTLEAKLEDPAAQKAYRDYRAANGDSLSILDPELFILTEIQTGKRTSFKANFQHLSWESEIRGLQGVTVTITRIIQFRKYNPNESYPDRLTYQLFGNAREVFLAHQVTAAPSFQQVVKLKDIAAFLSPTLIASNPLLVIPTKQLSSSSPRVMRTAVLSNGTHILLSPPVGTINPREPLKENEELEVQFAGETTLKKLTVGKLIYFDVRILNK